MTRRAHNFTAKQRVEIALRANGRCEACGAKLKPGEGQADHVIPVAMGGESVVSNGQWMCSPCHLEKTTKADVPGVAKAKRRQARDIGAIRPAGKIKSAGFAKPAPRRKATAPVEKLQCLPRPSIYE
jgi:5-methylcytosine-specific restriction protein A